MIRILNLWLPFVIGYGIIWAAMIWANRKRGKPIEDPDISKHINKKKFLIFCFLPHIICFLCSLFVQINIGILFWVGLPIFIIGVIINLISMYSFSQTKDDLNTFGIYRYSRNPMYVGLFLFITGLNLIGWTKSLVFIIFVILSVLWISTTHWSVLQEESFLENKYGNSFRKYKRRVPRYIFRNK